MAPKKRNKKKHVERKDLGKAIMDGDFLLIKKLINNNNINKPTSEGIPPLNLAARNDNYYLVEFLLERGADINKRDWNDMTPILHAATSGNFNMFEYLVDNGADITARGMLEMRFENKLVSVLDIAKMFHNNEMINYINNDVDFAASKIQRKFKSTKEINKTKTIARARATDRVLAIKNKQYPKGVIPKELARHIGSYVAFGKTPVLSKTIKNKAKKLKIRLTVTRNGKRVYKTRVVLERQIKNKMK
jgi:hypothetical protein